MRKVEAPAPKTLRAESTFEHSLTYPPRTLSNGSQIVIKSL